MRPSIWQLMRPKFNPFSSIVPERDDKQRRLPLSETDIRNVKRNLDQLDKGDQLLFRVLAATGMRLSEAFEIDDEMKERRCRYVIVGRKTSQSLRRVPLPAAVLPFLPREIEGARGVETSQSILEEGRYRRPSQGDPFTSQYRGVNIRCGTINRLQLERRWTWLVIRGSCIMTKSARNA
jgi:integrase